MKKQPPKIDPDFGDHIIPNVKNHPRQDDYDYWNDFKRINI